MRSFFLVCLGLAALALSGCGRAGVGVAPKEGEAEEIPYPEPAYLPGGVADFSGKTGFLSNPKGGIDAVDLESGAVLWHSDAASYPLLIHNDRLYAQERHDANPLRIVALSIPEKGKQLLRSDPIDLFPGPKDDPRKPSRVVPPDLMEHPLFCTARWRGGQLDVEWSATVIGAALVHPITGKITPTRAEFGPGPAGSMYRDLAKTAADPDALGSRYGLQKAPLKPLEHPEPRKLFDLEVPGDKDSLRITRRWVAGNTLAVTISRHQFEHSDGVLVCWDLKTGKNLRSVRVAKCATGEGLFGTVVSHVADYGRCLVTRSANEDRRGVRSGRKEYFVISVETGANLHQLTPPDDYSAPWPVGSRVFYVVRGKDHVSGTLKAVDIVTQKLLWERPIVGNLWRERDP